MLLRREVPVTCAYDTPQHFQRPADVADRPVAGNVRLLIRKACEARPKGGAFVAVEEEFQRFEFISLAGPGSAAIAYEEAWFWLLVMDRVSHVEDPQFAPCQ